MASHRGGLGTGLNAKLASKLRMVATGRRPKRTAPVTFAQRVKAWRAGFSGTTWLLYDLDNRSPADFVPDAKSAAMAAIDGPVARSVLKNKVLFEKVVGRHARVPRIFAVVEKGTVTCLDSDWQADSAEGLVDMVRAGGVPVILKPVDASEGRDVHRLESVGGDLSLDGRPCTDADAVKALHAATSVMVCELINQGGQSGRVFPGALNTLRVITMVDPENEEPFVVSALHRFGTSRSAPTDNISRGGIRALVDIETGTLSAAGASWSMEEPGRAWKWDRHVETNEQIAGLTLTAWPDVKALVLDLVRRLPFLLYVGWDVAITDSGIVIVEGNHSPNLTQQVAVPYLANERVRKVLRHHGVVA